jgi:hypothetical protein
MKARETEGADTAKKLRIKNVLRAMQPEGQEEDEAEADIASGGLAERPLAPPGVLPLEPSAEQLPVPPRKLKITRALPA